MCVQDAKGMLINITGGDDMTLFEVDAAVQLEAHRVRIKMTLPQLQATL